MEDLKNKTKEELIDRVNELLEQLNDGKYGLYFDHKANQEDIVLKCQKGVPYLTHEEQKDVLHGGTDNVLIEGDNYAALGALNEIYPNGFVDVIYIDPPYNTGNSDFIYNDKFVDSDDCFRHTKWLNFMEKRLNLCESLLTDEGVIYISIDEREYAQLKLLCDKIFGESSYVTTFIWHNNKKGRQMDKYIKNTYEFILMYCKDKNNLNIVDKEVEASFDKYSLSDEISHYKKGYPLHNGTASFDINNRPNLCYSIYYNLKDQSVILLDEKVKVDDKYTLSVSNYGQSLINEGYIRIVPKKNEKYGTQRVWRWGKEKFLAEYKTELMLVKEEDGYYFYQKERIDEKGFKKQKNTNYIDIDTSRGKNEINKIFNNQSLFGFPKPLDLIKQLLTIVDDRYQVVLDFFAGSGTTGQAVLELNKQDNGKRKFILCTNNENNIMSDVCYPRLKTVITGVRTDNTLYSEGLEGSVRYFKVDFSENDSLKNQNMYTLAESCDGLLNVLEDCYDKYGGEKSYNIYFNSKTTKTLSIFNDNYDEKLFGEMLDKVSKLSYLNNVVYYYSLWPDLDATIEKKVLEKLPSVIVKPMPYKIYDIYDKIVKDSKKYTKDETTEKISDISD